MPLKADIGSELLEEGAEIIRQKIKEQYPSDSKHPELHSLLTALVAVYSGEKSMEMYGILGSVNLSAYLAELCRFLLRLRDIEPETLVWLKYEQTLNQAMNEFVKILWKIVINEAYHKIDGVYGKVLVGNYEIPQEFVNWCENTYTELVS